MNHQDYTTTVIVNATTQEAFEGITHVAGWWTENTVGSAQNTGDVFTVHFGETWISSKVIDCIPFKKITWLVTDCHKHWLKDKQEWQGTEMSFEISGDDNQTQVRFTHLGLVPGIECYNGCSNAWGQYMQSLKSLINSGKGKPDLKEA